MNGRRSLWRVFGLPLLIAAVSLYGLVWALLVEGPADILAALAAGCALLFVIRACLGRG
jgi:hypothetical protein